MSRVSEHVTDHNSELLKTLPFSDSDDFADADRGFLGALPSATIRDDSGQVVWDNDSYGFLGEECPPTVNPSLWRQSQLTSRQGIYEVREGIYQVRGLDLSNITFVEGDEGVIVIDPLISTATASAAYDLYRQHRDNRPVTGVIYTHSHADHFGGVKGIVDEKDVKAGRIPILAPEGFVEHAVSENVYAGTAMARRAGYMYGAALEHGREGQVGVGLGQTTSTGLVTLIPPTIDITTTGQVETVDGVRMVFQLAPGSEAPAEMHIYFPDLRALCMAENATRTLHNILTLRGALVRDARSWSRYLTEAISLFGKDTDVAFASHHWPTWGNDKIVTWLSLQRDLYAYLHDQTLRMLNRGYTGDEIAEQIQLPPALENAWHARGYYGSVSHNVKAIYQRYMGWFDGNPAHLWPHPPEQAARRYVSLAGGPDRMLAAGQEAFDRGDFRWAAEVLNHLVFANPKRSDAKELLAATYEQLAYGAENGPWRNFYLSGSHELRKGNFGTPTQPASPDLLGSLSVDQIFDSVAIRIDGPRAWNLDFTILWNVRGISPYRTILRNGVLVYEPADENSSADMVVELTREDLSAVILGGVSAKELPSVTVVGDVEVLTTLLSVLDTPDPNFSIVTP